MTTDERQEASPSYALGQLTRALQAIATHPDPKVRAGAAEKIERWTAVLEGMATGRLDVGSRTPVSETPAWVTLEVAHGGFATGRYLAEGALRAHEVELLARLPPDTPGATERERLNLYFASDQGQAELRRALAEGRYEIDLPEEAALLVATTLLDAGEHVEALRLLETIRPLMYRLRFYPRLVDEARSARPGVHVASAGAIARQLRQVSTPPQLLRMNATLAVWNPLYDELVSIWLATVEGDAPRLRTDGGALARGPGGQPIAEGGWPCRRWPGDWVARRELWLARHASALREHGASGRHHSPKSNFRLLRGFLERCPSDAAGLGPRDVEVLRYALACAVHRHGVPGTQPAVARRAEQARMAARPLYRHVAEVVATRLERLPPDEGVPTLELVTEPIAHSEHPQVTPGTQVPHHFVHKAERALLAPIDELVERGIIGSAEVLAIVLPQLTSQVAAAGIEDPTCRQLFAETYAAFRRRRSLLLLNLEHQVTLDELPWVRALAPFRRAHLDAASLARQTLRDVTLLTFEHFPHTIIPNPLLQEMSALARQAGLELPLVEEIAADIFMGTFTLKFSEAAEIASQTLAGTLYARYYDLPEAPASSGPPGRLRKRWGKTTDSTFDARCASRADEAGAGGGFVARSGAVLEQMQILTSYNLAVLVHGLDLAGEVSRRAPALARRSLRWALERHVQLPDDRFAQLRAIKNAAYAWRQAIFFLSFVDAAGQRPVLDEAVAALGDKARDRDALTRLGPALAGLRQVLDGARFDASGHTAAGGRRYLGWSRGPHWLLPPVTPPT